MKHLKTVAALAVATGSMVLLAVGTASAGVLCKNGTTTTACTEPYKVGTTLSATISNSKITDTSGNTLHSCTGGTLKASITNAGGVSTAVAASITEHTWSGCSPTTDTVKGGELMIRYIAGTDNGKVSLKGTEFTVNIFSSCNYGPVTGGETDIGTLTGGKGASISLNAVLRKTAGGFLCPETTKWVGTYNFTEPESLFVAAA